MSRSKSDQPEEGSKSNGPFDTLTLVVLALSGTFSPCRGIYLIFARKLHSLICCSGLIFRIRIQQALSPQGAHKAVDFCKRHRKAKELKNKGGQKTMKERA